MICPRCNIRLEVTNSQGVEIDTCPNCQGLWLNRDDLDKIIERSSTYDSAYIGINEHGNEFQPLNITKKYHS